tara:strand:+ start:90 stop:488 length:399 start_codon:yes stop_codon:yes gene_type:complete
MKDSFVVFDGNCPFCNKTVLFFAKNDKNNSFKFVSSVSEFGVNIITKLNIKGLVSSTIILVENESGYYIKSIAIRKLLLKLPYYKFIGLSMFLFPQALSNFIYDLISKKRKSLIKNEACQTLDSSIRNKFIL